MDLTAIDVETQKICYENPVPQVICMSHAGKIGEGVGLTMNEFGGKFATFLDNGNSVVGHNIAFDLSVLCFQYPELWEPVFKAYHEERVYDTLLRERLLMLTTNGDFNVLYTKHGMEKIPGYKLCDLEMKYLGIDRSELKKDPDSIRYHYEELAGIPVCNWPHDAVQYSLDDSVNCLAIYEAQEVQRRNVISEIGYDPFAVENFRTYVAFALRLLECRGEKTDPEMILKVTKQYKDDYNAPELVEPLVKAGLLVLGKPEMPYARGTKAHVEDCVHNSKHPDYKAGRKQLCECPPKMKKATDDKMPTKILHKLVWGLAFQTEGLIRAWPAPKCKVNFNQVDEDGYFRQEFIEDTQGIIPEGITLQCNDVWQAKYADKEELIDKYFQRIALRKIVTDYLPKLYCEDGTPAEILRCSFFPLKKTGRSSSKAPVFNKKLTYPGRNGQNVDPRIRPCTVARDGHLIISTDYSNMELATLGQRCINEFGSSILADKINNGDDTHAYLAAQIAAHMDDGFAGALAHKGTDVNDREQVFQDFMKCKESKMRCNGMCPQTTKAIKSQYLANKSKEHEENVTWHEFWKFFRTFAKPTGLGYPGGLMPATMVDYAKGGYKIELTLETATQLRQIWLDTYPEMGQYLLWIKNHCRDPFHKAEYEKKGGKKRLHQFYCYDTPRGMHRARCDYCACANGVGLQAFAAEGALDALCQVQKAMVLANEVESICSYLEGCYCINFVHDEIIWECPDDGDVDARVEIVDRIMVEAMEKLTPDVKARTASTAMRRWYKEAEPTFNEAGLLIPWEPERETVNV
jgi:hypothetical protein